MRRRRRRKYLAMAALAVAGVVYTFRLNPAGLGSVDTIVVVVLSIVAVVMAIRGFST